MRKVDLFNYESKDLVGLATRVPKEFRELLKVRAAVDGVSIQDLVIYIIGNYITSSDDIDAEIERLKVKSKKFIK